MKNNNRVIIKKLSNRSLKQNKMRNLMAIAAIVLTTLLFTALFTVSLGLVQLTEEQTMRQVGSRAHAGLKNVTLDQCLKIVDNPMVVDWNYNRILGFASNEELAKRNVQVEWTTEKNMESSFKELKEGKLPENEDEIVLDDIVMEMLGVPKRLGEEVEIKFNFLNQEYRKTFKLSGWYEGDRVAKASSIYVADAYFQELCDGKTDADLLKLKEETKSEDNGLIYCNIYFKNSSNIEEKVIQLIQDAGYAPGSGIGEVDYGVNWAYMSTYAESVDFETATILVLIIFVILLTGYLIIYNIFQISIMKDIRFYGLLKTIGTTKKQIRRLVQRQAMMLSLIGIPVGLFLGYLVGLFVIPTIFSMIQLKSNNFHMEANPLIFLFSAVFSIITVAISCHKPSKIAGKVSPIEAVKYQEISAMKKGCKKRRQFGIAAMAYSNLKRNMKKTVLVVLSLSLSIVVLVEIVTIVKSFRISKYLEGTLIDDFSINSAQLNNFSNPEVDLEVEEDYIEFVKGLDGVKRLDEMYTAKDTSFHYLSEDAWQTYKDLYQQGLLYETEFTQDEIMSVMDKNTSVSETRYAYSNDLLKYLKVLEGTIDSEKFQSGDYVILGTVTGTNQAFYHPGDKIKLLYHAEDAQFLYDSTTMYGTINMHYEPSEEKEYEVMAVVEIPSSLTTQRYTMNGIITILPIDELCARDYSAIRFNVGVDVEDSMEKQVEEQISQYVSIINPKMDYQSKQALSEEFNSMTRGYLIIGGAIALVIGMIGILNFMNTMMTNVISRRMEIAMLQSIGLTDQQLKRMLLYEGCYYVLFTMGTSIILGSIISVLFIKALSNVLMWFEFQFVISPYFIVFPILFIIAWIVPLIAYHNTKKLSVVERLRESE